MFDLALKMRLVSEPALTPDAKRVQPDLLLLDCLRGLPAGSLAVLGPRAWLPHLSNAQITGRFVNHRKNISFPVFRS